MLSSEEVSANQNKGHIDLYANKANIIGQSFTI